MPMATGEAAAGVAGTMLPIQPVPSAMISFGRWRPTMTGMRWRRQKARSGIHFPSLA